MLHVGSEHNLPDHKFYGGQENLVKLTLSNLSNKLSMRNAERRDSRIQAVLETVHLSLSHYLLSSDSVFSLVLIKYGYKLMD